MRRPDEPALEPLRIGPSTIRARSAAASEAPERRAARHPHALGSRGEREVTEGSVS
jgi:hypothetical protein